jgi:hypothetical protein
MRSSRSIYCAGLAGIMVMAAVSQRVEGAESLSLLLLAALADHKILWIFTGIAVWQILRSDHGALTYADVLAGSSLAAAALLTDGLWPWLFLAAAMCHFVWAKETTPANRGQLMLLVLALHEVIVATCGTLVGDSLLAIDAAIARGLSSMYFGEVGGTGTAMQIGAGHLIVLVWGCSSLSYLGNMLLLFWAVAILLSDDRNALPRSVWIWIGMVAVVTVLLNTARIGLMAIDSDAYALFHHGDGATWFRIANLAVAVGAAWMWSHHETSRSRRAR